MIRVLFLLHRYFGIVFGILVSLWCLSAFVMMYVPYPALDDDEALAGLDRLDLSRCCVRAPAVDPSMRLSSFHIEMVAGEPFLTLDTETSGRRVVSLATGEAIAGIAERTAREQALRYLANSGSGEDSGRGAWIDRDQWTVSGGFDPQRPLYRFRSDDLSSTEVYVSGVTGALVQRTTGRERFWNGFGAVVHWLYPVVLRRHPALWQQSVIWTSAAGMFLVATGIYIGWRQYGARRGGRPSPYRGVALWHHYCGLAFGVLTLAWLASGFLSVNPFGLLASDDAAAERRTLAGATFGVEDVLRLLPGLRRLVQSEPLVRIESAPFLGVPAILAFASNGKSERLDPRMLERKPLEVRDLRRAASVLAPPGVTVAEAGLMNAEDSYYFAHHEPVSLPVYRVILADQAGTRFYIDPATGRLLLSVDRNARWYRWLFEGLHRGDFFRWLRRRPVWDAVMLPLLLGVTASALTGTWLGVRRLIRRRPPRIHECGPENVLD